MASGSSHFAEFIGHSIQNSTLEEQLRFAAYEVKRGTEAGNWQRCVVTAGSLAEKTAAFDRHIERSAGTMTGQRVANATAIAKYMDEHPNVGQMQEVAQNSPPLSTPHDSVAKTLT